MWGAPERNRKTEQRPHEVRPEFLVCSRALWRSCGSARWAVRPPGASRLRSSCALGRIFGPLPDPRWPAKPAEQHRQSPRFSELASRRTSKAPREGNDGSPWSRRFVDSQPIGIDTLETFVKLSEIGKTDVDTALLQELIFHPLLRAPGPGHRGDLQMPRGRCSAGSNRRLFRGPPDLWRRSWRATWRRAVR